MTITTFDGVWAHKKLGLGNPGSLATKKLHPINLKFLIYIYGHFVCLYVCDWCPHRQKRASDCLVALELELQTIVLCFVDAAL